MLNDLPKRIKAFNIELRYIVNAALFIVMDNDTRDTSQFYAQLKGLSETNNISIDHVYCIAIEELEAWLLGDINAIKFAYPALRDRIATKHSQYTPDEIRQGGTWEFLAEMLTKKGYSHFIKANPSYYDVGRRKSEWAEHIGKYMEIRQNQSPSFNKLIDELDKRVYMSI